MTPTEKLEELLVNLQIQLDLVLQAIKATTQNEAESKRFIMEAMQKYFGSSALQAKGSKSSSVFSRLEYLQEKESKPKTDAFGRMRPVDDDDEYSLPFVNKKGGSNDMKSITSSNDEDLMPTHNPFVKGLPLGSKYPSPPSRSGFVRFGDSSKESPFSSAAKGASPKPYYSPRGERTYQNSSARGRSGQRGRGREFENRGAARGWENRRNYDTKISYRGSPSGSRGGYDFRSKNRYEQRSESKLDESPERRTPKFISRFGNGKSEKIDAFGKPRPIDDDDSPTPIRKTDAFGKPRPVDDDLDGSPLSIFSSKKTKSLENQESGAENSPSTSKKGISKSLKLSLERSEKGGSMPKIDAFGKPRPVDDEDDQFRLPVVHKNDSKLKIVPPTSFEKPETKNRKKVDAFGKPRPIDETEEVMPMCGGGKSIVDQIATSAVQEAKQFDSFGQIRPLNEVFGSNIPEENKSIWLGESKPILSPKIAALMENFKLQKF